MLALARGLATQPAVLLLDELSMGLAPLIVEELYEQVAAIAADRRVDRRGRAVRRAPCSASPTWRPSWSRVASGPSAHPGDIEADLAAAYLGRRRVDSIGSA